MALKGKKLGLDHVKKILISRAWYKPTTKTKEKIRKALSGRKLSERHKQNIGLSNTGKRHSLETRKRLSEIHKKEKSSFWKGGITKINMRIRTSLEYRLWREAIFERDSYVCVWCGLGGGWNKELKKCIIIQADHIKPFALFPELRFAIDNGRTLCKDCHKKTDTWGHRTLNKL